MIVGHVNKEGAIAGPKVLEHMVDCVLYFEGDPNTHYRLLRAEKNRFGSTNEIGVFEMVDTGLKEIPNPSEVLLAGRPAGAPGTLRRLCHGGNTADSRRGPGPRHENQLQCSPADDERL